MSFFHGEGKLGGEAYCPGVAGGGNDKKQKAHSLFLLPWRGCGEKEVREEGE